MHELARANSMQRLVACAHKINIVDWDVASGHVTYDSDNMRDEA